jgi:Sec-independent protein secretion pathway component TatC
MLLLYELSILLCKVFTRKKIAEKDTETEEEDEEET